jgi:ribonucleoside-diphosphate reductase alpha subunit
MTQIIKRDGRKEPLQFDKITERIKKLSEDLDIDPASVSLNVIKMMKDGMTTRELDKLTYEDAISRSTISLDYSILASRIAWNDLHKSTPGDFDVITDLFKTHVSSEYYEFVKLHIDIIKSTIDYSRDERIALFGFKTLEDSYLWRYNGVVIERYQDMLMRIAVSVNIGNIVRCLETYQYLSNGYYTHATATLFHAGQSEFQGSSCFLLECPDSIEGIFQCIKYCALISKYAGGIGVDVTPVRGKGAFINGTRGYSQGTSPFIKAFEATAVAVNQGSKRNGAIALSMQPWHPDVEEFLGLRLTSGSKETQAKDIFTALFIPDIFMKRVSKSFNNKDKIVWWSLFCPKKFPELIRLHGNDFELRYLELESKKLYERQIRIDKLWEKVIISLIDSGTPYMLSKDNINRANNQENIGVITSTNLCCEIMEYHDENNIAVCNLSSIALPKYVLEDNQYDFIKLGEVVRHVVVNMNTIIDLNFSPVEIANKTNSYQRPLGIGVQGLSDVYCMMLYSWESDEASSLNKEIFETIYYNALLESCNLAQKYGAYDAFQGSPLSRGLFHFDLYQTYDEKTKRFTQKKIQLVTMNKFNWEGLRVRIMRYGVRNSLLIALMPTASTAQILGNVESIECFNSNLYMRKVKSGNFTVVNKHLYNKLKGMGLWNEELREELLQKNGSIAHLDHIPKQIRDVFKTVWEIKQMHIAKQACDRAPFIDQSQSLNFYYERPEIDTLTRLYLRGWKGGLKTLSYYMRTRPAADPIKYGAKKKTIVCKDDVCTTCCDA